MCVGEGGLRLGEWGGWGGGEVTEIFMKLVAPQKKHLLSIFR